jgi:hypothetical protein
VSIKKKKYREVKENHIYDNNDDDGMNKEEDLEC